MDGLAIIVGSTLDYLAVREVFGLRLVAKWCTFRHYNYVKSMMIDCRDIARISDMLFEQAEVHSHSFNIYWDGDPSVLHELLNRPWIYQNIRKLRYDRKYDNVNVPEIILANAVEVEFTKLDSFIITFLPLSNVENMCIRRSSLWALNYVPKLTRLRLEAVETEGMKFSRYLPNLTELYLADGSSWNIAEINKLTGLRKLHLNCKEEGLNGENSNFSHLPVSLINLDISYYDSEGLDQLSHLTNLKELKISCLDTVSDLDIAAVSHMPKLKSFSTDCVGDTSPLADCTQLEELSMMYCYHAGWLPDLAPTLKKLQFTETKRAWEPLTSLSCLLYCVRLQELDISHTEIEDISMLEICINLVKLKGRGTFVKSIGCLAKCTKLRELDLGIAADEIEALQHTTSLEELTLSLTKPVSLEPLVELPRLAKVALKASKRYSRPLSLDTLPLIGVKNVVLERITEKINW